MMRNFVILCRLNGPRYATLQNIMKARQKTLQRETLASLGVELQEGSMLRTIKTEEPQKRSGGVVMLSEVDELAATIVKSSS